MASAQILSQEIQACLGREERIRCLEKTEQMEDRTCERMWRWTNLKEPGQHVLSVKGSTANISALWL